MTNIEKQFVPYEQSLKLRELGYNESCFGWNFINSEVLHLEYINNQTDYELLRPLWQQAFDYIFKIYRIYGIVDIFSSTEFTYRIEIIGDGTITLPAMEHPIFNELHDARIACLDKLIELCQEK